MRNAWTWTLVILVSVGGGCVTDQCPPATVETNGLCVRDTDAAVEGAWCRADSDCNPEVRPGTCDSPSECRGSRPHSACVKGTCGPVTMTRDDSPCSPSVEARTCGAYRSVFCSGSTRQTAPDCPESCTSDDDCDDDAKCLGGHCSMQTDAGTADADASDACAKADCCQTAADCPAKYTGAATCEQPEQCQGSRPTAVCTDHRCGSVRMADDTACTKDVIGRRCPNGEPSVMCTGDVAQVAPPECSTPTMQASGSSTSGASSGSMMPQQDPPQQQPSQPQQPPTQPASTGPKCGNGIVEPGERCDGNCPTSCDDHDPCTGDMLTGSAGRCSVQCTHDVVTMAADGDGCCPDGVDVTADNDCKACFNDSGCPSDKFCVLVTEGERKAGTCVPTQCGSDPDCTDDRFCENGSCVHRRAGTCDRNRVCPVGLRCLTTGMCG